MELAGNQPREFADPTPFSDPMDGPTKGFEEPDTCRICRGEGTEEEQLFYPCKCSGSIKFVHQACLVEWLSHSQKKYCELCKTPFRFTKLYDPNMPHDLPATLFMKQLLIHGFRTILTWLRFVLVAFVWLGWLPWSMRAIWRALFWLADGRWSDTEISRRQVLGRLNQLVANGTISMDAVASAIGTAMPTTGATDSPSVQSDIPSVPSFARSEPMMLTAVKKALSAIIISASSSNEDSANAKLTNATTGSVKLRHPSWLSDVKFLNSLTPSPTINNIIIDTLEGQLITLLVVISFILIFLIREWVVQQQPMANIADGEREAAVQLIANNRQNREAEAPQPEPQVLLQPEDQPPNETVNEHVEDFTYRGEEDVLPGTSTQLGARELASSIRYNDSVALGDMPSEGSSSNIRGITVDDESSIGHLFGQPPAQVNPVWPGLEIFKDLWTRGNGDPEEVLRIIREEGRQEELGWVIAAMSRLQRNTARQFALGRDQTALDTNWIGFTDASSEQDSTAAPGSRVIPQSDTQDGSSHVTLGAVTDHPLDFSNTSSMDDINTNFSRHGFTFSFPESEHENMPSDELEPAEQNHNSFSRDQVRVDPDDGSANNSAANDMPNTVDESSRDVPQSMVTESPALPPRSLTQRVLDWFWADITPAEPAQEQQNQDDEHIVEDPALEAPFIPVRDNQRFANAGMREEPGVAAIAADAGLDANEVEAIEDGDDLEGIMELIGMQGPIFGLLQNAVFSALLISFTVAIGIWLPYLWGKIAVVLLANPIPLFFGIPMAAIAIVADIALDTLIGSLGYIMYWVSVACKVLISPLGPLIPLGDWIPHSTSVTSTSLCLIDASSRRLRKVVSAFFVFHESDVPMFSVLSHQALKIHEARIFSLFRAVFMFGKFIFHDFPLRIIWLGSPGALSGLDLNDAFAQFKQFCSLGTSRLLSIGGKKWLGLGMTATSTEIPLDYGLAVWDTKDRVIAITMGYVLASVMGILYLRITGLFSGTNRGQRIEGLVAEILHQAGGVMKVILIIGIEMILFPLYCGSLLDLALLPLFDNATIASRMEFTASSPMTSLFVHWFIGTCYMFHFALFVSMCRKIMRTGVLYFIRDPDDPTFHPVRDVLERNITTQLRKIAFSALVYGALVIVCLGGVVWGLYFAFDGVLPIRWSSTTSVFEFPIDLLFYNFVVPLAIRSMKPSDGLHNLYDWWFHKCARLLRLTNFFFGERRPDEEGRHVRRTWMDILSRKQGDAEHPVVGENEKARADQQGVDAYFLRDGKFARVPASDQVRIPKGSRVFLEVTENNERVDGAPDPDDGLHGRTSTMFTKVYIPPSFRTRIAAFILLIWLFTATAGVGITVLPLVIGRKVISSYFSSNVPVNDVYAISTGLCIAGGAAYAVFYCRDSFAVVQDRIRPYLHSPWQASLGLGRIALHAIRLVFISTTFSVLLPSLIAMVIELYLLVPLHTYFGGGEAHVIRFAQDWALGVLYLQMVIKFILWNSTSRPAAALNAIFRDGWLRPNVKLATRAFILPVSILAVVAMALPLVFGFVLNLTVFRSVPSDVQCNIYRYSYPITFAMGLAIWLCYLVRRQVEVWRVNIRDDVYLIGERLHNFSEKRVKDVGVPRRVITS